MTFFLFGGALSLVIHSVQSSIHGPIAQQEQIENEHPSYNKPLNRIIIVILYKKHSWVIWHHSLVVKNQI